MIRPTELVARAAGIAPLQVQVADIPGRCAMCGHPHEPGTPIAPFAPADSFTDYPSLIAPNSTVICGWCAATWSQDFTQTHLKSIICEQGVFPAASNDHIAYWLLNPPEPPFMLMIGDQKRQHVVWRTPVNLSKDIITLRFGEQLFTIRPKALKEAVDQINVLISAFNASSKKKRKSPFMSLSRDVDTQMHGLIANEILAFVETRPELQVCLDTINALSSGELWGLTSVLYAQNPHKPEAAKTPADHTRTS